MLRMFALFLLLVCPFAAGAEDRAPMSQGAYLARMGDCVSCHTVPGQPPFAGGFRVNSPMGPIYGSNITPDADYGIGRYSLEDFTRAVRQGIAKDGRRLYPAMPYPDFARISDEDMKALYDYFMHEVAPVHIRSPQTQLSFPYNQRWGIRFWDWAFTRDERYHPNSERDAVWNRGAYLVQSLAHCGSCHTPRGPAYEQLGMSESSARFLSGDTLDYWHAPSLRSDDAAGLGRWPEAQIADFLGNGHSAGAAAFGSMTQVVENSGQYITPEDRAAIAHYIKSLAASGDEASYHADAKPDSFEQPGAGMYAGFCAGCHQADGSGRHARIPALAGNAAVLSSDATSVIRIVLEGGATPRTDTGPAPSGMPGFEKRLTDGEIADLVTYIRRSWGNQASAVTPRQVRVLREALEKQPD